MDTEEIERILSTRPPRDIEGNGLRHLVPRSRGRILIFLLGIFFTLFSIPFLWIFFPWGIVDSLRLDLGTPIVARGTISSVEETDNQINGRTLRELRFETGEGVAASSRGRSWTTHWFEVGDTVNIEYLESDPNVARVEGTTLDPFGYFGSFTTIFTIIGVLLLFGAVNAGRTTARLLVEGEPIVGEVAAVRRHGDGNSSGTSFEVQVRYRPDGIEYAKTFWVNESKGTWLEEHFEHQAPVAVLYDSAKPKRAIVLELL